MNEAQAAAIGHELRTRAERIRRDNAFKADDVAFLMESIASAAPGSEEPPAPAPVAPVAPEGADTGTGQANG